MEAELRAMRRPSGESGINMLWSQEVAAKPTEPEGTMPDWAQQIIHNVSLLAVLGLYPACYGVFAWVEDRLSVGVKQEITAWLKSTGDLAAQHTLSFNLLRFHSELFGDKQLSVKCLVR